MTQFESPNIVMTISNLLPIFFCVVTDISLRLFSYPSLVVFGVNINSEILIASY